MILYDNHLRRGTGKAIVHLVSSVIMSFRNLDENPYPNSCTQDVESSLKADSDVRFSAS